MIGDMFNGNKRREVKTRADQVMWKRRKYRKEAGTGYYVCTTGKRRRLHDVIWEDTWGREVPPGCVIHHLNWDKTVNEAENLLCVTVWEHNMIHNKIGGKAGKQFGYKIAERRNKRNGECGVPGADAMWGRVEEGRDRGRLSSRFNTICVNN